MPALIIDDTARTDGDLKRALVQLHAARDAQERRLVSSAIGDMLGAMARADREDLLAALLTPDPDDTDLTWSVATYEAGSITPDDFRDFADCSPAVRTMVEWSEEGLHLAELIVSNAAGLRWVALSSARRQVMFQLPDEDSLTDSKRFGEQRKAAALARWQARIRSWAGPDPSDDMVIDHPVPGLPTVDHPMVARPGAPRDDADPRITRLLEANDRLVRRVEQLHELTCSLADAVQRLERRLVPDGDATVHDLRDAPQAAARPAATAARRRSGPRTSSMAEA